MTRCLWWDPSPETRWALCWFIIPYFLLLIVFICVSLLEERVSESVCGGRASACFYLSRCKETTRVSEQRVQPSTQEHSPRCAHIHTHVHTLGVKAAIVHTQDIQYPLIQAWKWLSVRPVSVSPSPRSFTKFLLIIFKRSLCQRGLCFLACLWNAAALWHSIPLFCWKTLNHGVTSLPILRKSSLASYLTLTLDVAPITPQTWFPSSRRLSW